MKEPDVICTVQLNSINMFHSIAPLAVVMFVQAAFAIDVSKPENQEFKYINKGVVPIAVLRDFMTGFHRNGFIEDLEIGKLMVNNIMAYILELNGSNWTKVINYVKVLNAENSYGAVCGEANDLGSNQSPRFWVRVAPYTNVTLTALIFAH